MDERTRHGHTAAFEPVFNMIDYKNASFFAIASYWLSAVHVRYDGQEECRDVNFLDGMAAAMQACGRAKATGPSDRWSVCRAVSRHIVNSQYT